MVTIDKSNIRTRLYDFDFSIVTKDANGPITDMESKNITRYNIPPRSLYPITPMNGFLFDFCRLYLSLGIHNIISKALYDKLDLNMLMDDDEQSNNDVDTYKRWITTDSEQKYKIIVDEIIKFPLRRARTITIEDEKKQEIDAINMILSETMSDIV